MNPGGYIYYRYMDTEISSNCAKDNGPKKQLEEYSFVDKSLLEKMLICNICSKLLNVSPILYNKNIGNICGRCSSDSTLDCLADGVRQQVNEDLIKNLTFPCINKNSGCIEVLKFDDVLSHERDCRFSSTNCPIFLFYQRLLSEKSCSWKGNTKLLCDHLKSHPESFLDPPQFEWPQDGKNMIFFTTVGNQVITVVIKYEKLKKYICLVMINGTELDSQCFRYQLKLSADEDKNEIIHLWKDRLEPFSNFVETLQYPEKMLKVDVDSYANLQNSKKIIAKLSIVKKSKEEIIQITGVKDSDLLSQASITATMVENPPTDERMLAQLECPVCREFMLPPIYIGITGRSLCSDCRNPIIPVRNYSLEKMAEMVKFPCRNRKFGCSFVTTSDKIREHQTSCELSENPCILKCGWKGQTPGLFNHFLDEHSQSLLKHNTAIILDTKLNKNISHFFLYVMGEMFCFSLKGGGKSIRFTIQHVGYLEPEPKYKYTMQISTVSEAPCLCITITNYCQMWNSNLAEALGCESVFIPRDILKVYLLCELYFKINITKVC